MKNTAFLLRALFSVVLLTCALPSKAQIDELFLSDFVGNEATYRSQSIVIERSSIDKPVTLREQLRTLFGNLVYNKAYVIQSYMDGMEGFVCENIDELLDKDPVFLSYDKVDGKLNRKQFEINTSIYLNYKDENGRESCLVIHNRPRGFLNSTVYTRTSIMMPSDNQDDDCRSFLSNSTPMTTSYLTAFDVKDVSEEMLQFAGVLKSALRKYKNNEELSEAERQCIHGIKEEEELAYILSYGDWLYKNNRFYDAYTKYLQIFETLKKFLKQDEPGIKSLFYETSYRLGMSLWKLRLYDSAEYYLELAAFGNDSYSSDYMDFLSSQKNNLKKECKELNSGVTVGKVLSVLFDVNENNLREAVGVVNNQITKLATKSEVWNFDLKKLCTPEPSTLTMAYSRTYKENNDIDSIDKSILFYENNIIFSSVKVDDKRWRMNVMIPNFRSADYKKLGQRLNVPLSASFIIGSDEMKPIKIRKGKKFCSSLNAGIKVAEELKSEMRFVESLMLLKQMHRAVSLKSVDEQSEENIKNLHARILYEIGFHLTELNQLQKAIPYLENSLKVQTTYDAMCEYITILSNMVDPRCFDLVKSELEKSPEDKIYENFLNRRYAYLLIEYNKLDEAEVVLKRMLETPGNEKFARQELQYIESLRKK